MVNSIFRYFTHIFKGSLALQRYFPKSSLAEIDQSISAVEKSMTAEIAFVVEEKYGLLSILRGLSAKERALDLFSSYRVWDTSENNGVLIYLLLAERDIEIVVDRGVAKILGSEELEAVCREIEIAIRGSDVKLGVIAGIQRLGSLLLPHFPITSSTQNEVQNTASASLEVAKLRF